MLKPFEWKDRPSLMEHLFPVQKISAESFKEQMANTGKTLTALGSYWKGRKPLILNKACILGALLPATDNSLKALEIFELLMGMDKASLAIRQGRIKPNQIVVQVQDLKIKDWFDVIPETAVLPERSPFMVQDFPCVVKVKGMDKEIIPTLNWKVQIGYEEQLGLESQALPFETYQENVSRAKRPEELADTLHDHIWKKVNGHLGTSAFSFPELVEQMWIARFGHRPRVGDVFCGSGQIPFEAARLGCDVYASDLNPIACMLTWGAFKIVGALPEKRTTLESLQEIFAGKIKTKIDELNIETDGTGWQAKAYLYCLEVKCPETDWMVPLIPSLMISQPQSGKKPYVVAKLEPIRNKKRYDIKVVELSDDDDLNKAEIGTVQGGEMVHSPDGVTVYRTKISTLRGDYKDGKENQNRLRLWEKSDFVPRPDDIYQERLYCVQWMRKKPSGKGDEYKFRAVDAEDLKREQKVFDYVGAHLAEWQEKGYVPDMVIEAGEKTDEPIRTRGWTHWHHLFNARQLLQFAFIQEALLKTEMRSEISILFAKALEWNSRLDRWHPGWAKPEQVFYNQALNTLYNYGCRSYSFLKEIISLNTKCFTLLNSSTTVNAHPAQSLATENDIYLTDPPYGDAVKYEEITEFFIAWLRKSPPPEFAHWTWDSRRSLAVKGDGEGFRSGMIAAYRKMAEKMPDNGIQVLMFTHQSGNIWADMTNIIWASGLQVTAAWYVVTETDSALRQGANVTGTVMLVLRKRTKQLETFRDELGWEIETAVKEQVESLIGLDKTVREHHSEGLYTDADLQMAGYAAALKVLTAYSKIDGKDMVTESEAPRIPGRKTFVEELINFAVQTAVQFLIPEGFDKNEWQKLAAVERFYLKMADMEHQGMKTLDNYQNFAKAFKVHHFDQLMSDASKANAARLKLSADFKGALMSGDAEIVSTPLRALLYALFEVTKEIEVDDVLLHLMQNCANFLQVKPLIVIMADYLAEKRGSLKPTKTFRPDLEASAARTLAEALRNQRV